MDDFLHNLRSGKLKQPDRSNRPYSDPQYKGGQRRNAMDRRKKELDAFERLNAVKEALESISETQKRMAEAYEARTRAEERKARAMGCCKVTLEVQENNRRARQVYEAAGFFQAHYQRAAGGSLFYSKPLCDHC